MVQIINVKNILAGQKGWKRNKIYYFQHAVFLTQEYFEIPPPIIIENFPSLKLFGNEENWIEKPLD